MSSIPLSNGANLPSVGRRARPTLDPSDLAAARLVALMIQGTETADGENLPGPWGELFSMVKEAVPDQREKAARKWCGDNAPNGGEAMARAIEKAMADPLLSVLSVPEEDDQAVAWPPLRAWGIPPVEPFPLDVLPEPAARLVGDAAEAIGCPRDFPALSILAVAGGVIGRSVSLNLKDGYFAHPTIFAAPIGPPSDGKTPAIKAVAAAVRRIDEALEAEHAQALDRWKEESERPGPNGKKQKPPPPPRPRRIDVDDITMEAIPLILADNPRGLIMIRDELTALVMGMNQYKGGGKGNDRANLLKIWSSDAIKKDRVGHEGNAPIRCPYPTMSIVGGLTPDMLGEMIDAKGRADGFLDRFLFSYPDPLPIASWSERGIPEATAEDWRGIVARLWARQMNIKEGRSVPHVATFTPEGKARWIMLHNAHTAEMNRVDFHATMRGPWGKFKEYAGRLTLILACLRHAADPTAEPEAIPTVGPRDAEDAWTLIGYFKSHARRVHAVIARGSGIGGGPVVKEIVDWLKAGDRRSFTVRDIEQAKRRMDHDERDDALKFLAGRNAIRRRPDPPKNPKGGRPPSPAYDVNPALLETQNTQNTQNPGPSEEGGGPFEGSEGCE